MTPELRAEIESLPGPILVLGAGGFIGSNLLKVLLEVRQDVRGVMRKDSNNFRLSMLTGDKIYPNWALALYQLQPQTVFNCIAYGGYPSQTNSANIYETNLTLVRLLVGQLMNNERKCLAFVHAGSSSEYGDNCNAPSEMDVCLPNSDYAVSKLAASNYLSYMGRKHGFPCVNLRLYSVYGPYEDASRLIPQLIIQGAQGKYPPLVRPDTTRDFVYIDDVCAAFIKAAIALVRGQSDEEGVSICGQSFNIGWGTAAYISDAARITKELFGLEGEPEYTMPSRSWDTQELWRSNCDRAYGILDWDGTRWLHHGMGKMKEWYESLSPAEREAWIKSSVVKLTT